MEQISRYLISVTAAAIISGITSTLFQKNKTLSAMGKLLAGLFLTLTVVKPLIKLEIRDFVSFTQGVSWDAGEAVSSGEIAANQAIGAIIKREAEAYILDKAAFLNAELTVEVKLSEDTPPKPCAVVLSGAVSPYTRTQLTQFISQNIGVPKEAQQWIG